MTTPDEGRPPLSPSSRLAPAWRWALGVSLGMRIALSGFAAAVAWLRPLPVTPDEAVRPYKGVAPIAEGLGGLLLGAWQRFDTNWYLHIAADGYAVGDGSAVYFPLYPALIRLLGDALGGRFLAAGLLISTVAYAMALYFLFGLSHREIDEDAAQRSIIYLALFPTAFFFLAAYTEALFLMLVLASFHFAQRGRAWAAGGLGFLAALTRLQGAIMVAPLAWIALRDSDFEWRRLGWRGLAPLLAPLGTALFFIYRRLWLGEAPIVQAYESRLHARFVAPWDNLIASVRVIVSPDGSFIDALNLAIAVIFIGLTVVIWRKLPREYGIYAALTMLALTLRMTTLQPLVSMSRYVLAVFPAFILLGDWGGDPWAHRLILYPSIALLAYLAGQFVMWGWVA